MQAPQFHALAMGRWLVVKIAQRDLGVALGNAQLKAGFNACAAEHQAEVDRAAGARFG